MYQLNLPYYSYQRTDKKGIYEVDKDPVENQPRGFYTTFDKENKNVNYVNKSFEEIVVNFIRI